MHSHENIKYIEKSFISAAKNNEQDTVKEIVALYPDLDINVADGVSGRSALHMAAQHQNNDLFEFLLKSKCDPLLKDNGSFTAFDLMINPCEYSPTLAESENDKTNRYYKFIVAEMSQKLPPETPIIFVYRIEDLSRIIDSLPKCNKIGFIIKKPNCIRNIGLFGNIYARNLHVAPVYFERRNNKEYFIQFDSILGSLFLMPEASNPTIKRESYYHVINRQSAGIGCFEDAVMLLTKCLRNVSFDLIALMQQHSQKDETCLVPLSPQQKKNLNEMTSSIMNGQASRLAVETLPGLRRKNDCEKMIAFYEYHNISPVKQIFQFDILPEFLLIHVNHNISMRTLRVKYPELFFKKIKDKSGKEITILDSILEQGQIYCPYITSKDIKHNLSNSDDLYDFKGKNMLSRVSVFKKYQKDCDQTLFFLFSRKIPLVHQIEKNTLVRKLTSFCTGIENTREEKVTTFKK